MSVRNSSWLFATAVFSLLAGPALAQDILTFKGQNGTASLLVDGSVAVEENTDPDASAHTASIEIEDVPKRMVNDPNPENGNNLTILGVSGTGANSDSIGLDGGFLMDDGLLSMTGPGAIANSYDVGVAKTITGGPETNDGAPSPTSEYSAFVGEISSTISSGDFGALGSANGGGHGQGHGQAPSAGAFMDAFNIQ